MTTRQIAWLLRCAPQATAPNVIKAYANCGWGGAGIANFVFSIHEDGPGGKQVGPACNTRMVSNWGTDAVWFPDAVKLTPGKQYYLQYRREDGEPFFSYLSADWEVARDRWGDVAIEIYYHRGHPYNVQRMIEAAKKSLEYFSTHFSPYQHRQLRILEFPRYARFAQSFPNTIPFSESIGFIANLEERDDDDEGPIDYVFYVTAHEIAHQWWAHQVIGGFVQGATVMSESLSQYSALMVREKEYWV